MNTSIMQHASFSELCKILDHEEDAVKKLIHNIFKTGLLFLPGLSIAFDSVFEALDSGLVLIDSISTVESISAEIKNVFGKKNTYEIRSQEAMTVHILMVYAAFFDTLRDYLPDEHKQIKLTNKEKATITQKSLDAYFERTKEQSTTPSSGINRIYEKALPLPYPTMERAVR